MQITLTPYTTKLVKFESESVPREIGKLSDPAITLFFPGGSEQTFKLTPSPNLNGKVALVVDRPLMTSLRMKRIFASAIDQFLDKAADLDATYGSLVNDVADHAAFVSDYCDVLAVGTIPKLWVGLPGNCFHLAPNHTLPREEFTYQFGFEDFKLLEP